MNEATACLPLHRHAGCVAFLTYLCARPLLGTWAHGSEPDLDLLLLQRTPVAHTDGLEPDRPRGDDREVQRAALSCSGEPRSLTGHLGVVGQFSVRRQGA